MNQENGHGIGNSWPETPSNIASHSHIVRGRHLKNLRLRVNSRDFLVHVLGKQDVDPWGGARGGISHYW